MTWDDVVGHEAIKAYLQRLVAAGRVAHAYALVGPEGIGKTLIASVFAQALLCPQMREGAPCDACRACRQASRHQHPDVHILAAIDGAIGIDRVRELQRELALKPYAAERKIAVIDGADAMTPAAQNSLLKTLEEPPGNTVYPPDRQQSPRAIADSEVSLPTGPSSAPFRTTSAIIS